MRNTTERRQEVLYFISDRRRVTYQQIADEFNISYNTARNDVEVLVCSHPIIIENWRGGGVCAMDGWYASKRYLTDAQEALLRKLTEGLQPEDQKTMESILTAFAKPQVKEPKN